MTLNHRGLQWRQSLQRQSFQAILSNQKVRGVLKGNKVQAQVQDWKREDKSLAPLQNHPWKSKCLKKGQLKSNHWKISLLPQQFKRPQDVLLLPIYRPIPSHSVSSLTRSSQQGTCRASIQPKWIQTFLLLYSPSLVFGSLPFFFFDSSFLLL